MIGKWDVCGKTQGGGRGEGRGDGGGGQSSLLRTCPNHCFPPPPPPLGALEGRPGDRVNLSCEGISHPTRWAWAPSFPACKGLSKGRRPIL